MAQASESLAALAALEDDLNDKTSTLSQAESWLDRVFDSAEQQIELLTAQATSMADAAVEKVNALKDGVASAFDLTRGKLGEVADALLHGENALQALTQTKSTLLTGNTSKAEGAKEVLSQIATAAQAHAEVDTVAEDLLAALTARTDELAEKAQALTEAFKDIDTSHQEQVVTLVERLKALSEMIEQRHSEFDTDADQQTQETVAGVAAKLETFLSDLEGQLEGARGAVQVFEDTQEAFGGLFNDDVKKVLGIVEQVVSLINNIKPVIELAKQLT